jgi:hypothetical protein
MKKTITPCLLLAAAALLSLCLPASAKDDKDASASRVTVTFENPEKFTDVKDSQAGTDKGRDFYLKELRQLVEEEAARLLPAGQKLTIVFTDIDLAGDYLPSMPADQNIRVMKDIYFPRMKFTYKITDAVGAVVKEGTENISDTNYLQNIAIVGRGEELFYDKALLRDWLRRALN